MLTCMFCACMCVSCLSVCHIENSTRMKSRDDYRGGDAAMSHNQLKQLQRRRCVSENQHSPSVLSDPFCLVDNQGAAWNQVFFIATFWGFREPVYIVYIVKFHEGFIVCGRWWISGNMTVYSIYSLSVWRLRRHFRLSIMGEHFRKSKIHSVIICEACEVWRFWRKFVGGLAQKTIYV